MNDLQRVITESQAAINNQYVFVHMKTPDLRTLLEGLEEAQREIADKNGHIEGLKVAKEYEIENHEKSCFDYQDQIIKMQREIDRLKQTNNNMWECGDCGFAYDACHVDVDEKDVETGENTCPLCAEESLTKENEKLRTEHAAMKNYLMELRDETHNELISSQITNVLSTLSPSNRLDAE